MDFASLVVRRRLLALCCLAVCWLPACGRSDAPELRLGFVATFSGDGFRAGRDALEAARFAVETATREGRPALDGQPCRIRLYVRDDKNSPQEAARVVSELITRQHVSAIIGPLTSETANAAAKAAEAAGVPLISPSATAAVVTAGRPFIFRIAFTDAFEGMVLGRLSVRELGVTRVAVLTDEENLASRSLTEAFIQAFTACGGQASHFPYPSRLRDFEPLVRQALGTKPEAIFLPNPSKEAVLAGLAARKLGFTGLLFGGDAWDGPEISRLPAFAGAVFVDHWREDGPGKRSASYAAAFRQIRRQAPTELGALTQDAVDVVLRAVAEAGCASPRALTRTLSALPSYDGVTGRFNFAADGNPIKSLSISRVTGNGTTLESRIVEPPAPCPVP